MCLTPHAKFSHFAKGMYVPLTNFVFSTTGANSQVFSLWINVYVLQFDNVVFYLFSQTCPNLPAKTAPLWRRPLHWRRSWMHFASMTLVRIRVLSANWLTKFFLEHAFLHLWVSCDTKGFIFSSFIHSCDCQTSPSSPAHGRTRIWGRGACWVYPPGTSAALWHPAPSPAVAAHQHSMCQCPCATWTLTALRADRFCEAWWQTHCHPSLPLAQKRRQHCNGHS